MVSETTKESELGVKLTVLADFVFFPFWVRESGECDKAAVWFVTFPTIVLLELNNNINLKT